MGRARQTSVVVKVLIRFGHARIVKTLASVIRSAGGEALPAPPKIRVAELLDLRAVLASESRLSSANRMPVSAGYDVPVGRFLRSAADRRTLSTPACGREMLFARAAPPTLGLKRQTRRSCRGCHHRSWSSKSSGRSARRGYARRPPPSKRRVIRQANTTRSSKSSRRSGGMRSSASTGRVTPRRTDRLNVPDHIA
jgi:hypothetical protein